MEIYGPEASGKTTLALHVIAEAQKQGGNTKNSQNIYIFLCVICLIVSIKYFQIYDTFYH